MSKITVHTEEQQPAFSELVLHELDYRHSRETVILAVTESPLPVGLVLTRNAQGEYEPLKENTGTLDEARAVLLKAPPVGAEAQEGVVIRRSAILNGAALQFDASVTKKAEAKLALSDLGIVIKE